MQTKSNTNRIKALFGFLFLAIASTILISAQQEQQSDELKIGRKMPFPTMEMTGSDGNTYTLADLKGENGLIVVFSCNTCPFVVGSDNFEGWEGQYNGIYEKAKAAKMGMVLVNSNAAKRDGVDSQEAMKEHAEAMGYKMHYVIDADAKLADALGAKTTPHVYVFNGSNKLSYKGSIDNSWDTQKTELETYLLDLIIAVNAGNEITTNSTTPRGCSIKRKK